MLKVHVVAIAANHAPETGLSISRHNLVKFLREARRLNPPRHQPGTCAQSLGSFKALVSSHFSYSPWQRLVSVKWDGDLQDLSVCAACSEFGPATVEFFKPRLVCSLALRAQVTTLLEQWTSTCYALLGHPEPKQSIAACSDSLSSPLYVLVTTSKSSWSQRKTIL